MRINIVINDQTIMEDILGELESMEEDKEITFNGKQEREEFASDIFDEIASKMECYADYFPTWENIWNTVHHMAECRE